MSSIGVLVLGVGNPLMGDDGIGLRLLAELREQWELGEDVALTDGGTWGMNLLPLVEATSALILLDAIDAGQAPGTVIELDAAGLPRHLSHKLSPHQIDLSEIFALCALRGTMPRRSAAIGIQPRSLRLQLSLSSEAAAAVPAAAERIVARLREWGFHAERREALTCTR